MFQGITIVNTSAVAGYETLNNRNAGDREERLPDLALTRPELARRASAAPHPPRIWGILMWLDSFVTRPLRSLEAHLIEIRPTVRVERPAPTTSARPPLVVIVGPTAAGKSALALTLAQRLGGEIVSADSRQVYRYMDVGTAKPTLEEQALVPHHLVDVVDPDGEYTLAHFQADAYRAIDAIHARGKLPLLVGGTGLYVRSVVEGLRIPAVPPRPELRAALEARARAEGHEAILAELAARDPLAAARIDPRNVRRVIRAIEVCEVSGRPFSSFQESDPPPYSVLTIGVRAEREVLYARIDARVDAQIAAGLVAENERLVARGYGYDLPAMSGLGYRQIGMYLRGEVTLARAIEILKFETHRFARNQHAWFRPDDPRIHWLAAHEHDRASEMLERLRETTDRRR